MSHIENKDLRVAIFEGLGTLIFAYGVGCASYGLSDRTPSDAILFSCSLLAGLALCAQITDGHLNPLLSIATHVYKGSRYIYVNMLGQFIGAFLGAIIFWAVTSKTAIPISDAYDKYDIVKYGVNQFVGSFLFGICVLVITNPRTTYASKSWQMYLSVVISLFLVRKMTGQTYINPALGVAHQLFSSIINGEKAPPLLAFVLIIPSLFGAAIAGFLMKHFYQPLLLYTRFKQQIDAEEQESHESHQ